MARQSQARLFITLHSPKSDQLHPPMHLSWFSYSKLVCIRYSSMSPLPISQRCKNCAVLAPILHSRHCEPIV